MVLAVIFLNACGNDNKNIANNTTANTTPGGNDLVVVQPVSPAQPAENETSGPSDTQVNVAVPNDRIIGQWKLAYITSIQNGQPVETVADETDYWTFFEDGTFTDAIEKNDNIHTDSGTWKKVSPKGYQITMNDGYTLTVTYTEDQVKWTFDKQPDGDGDTGYIFVKAE